MNCYDEICKHHEEGIKSMGVDNVTLIDSVTRMSQKFTWDGVHLTEEAGRNFVDSVLRASLTFFGAEFVDLVTDTNPMEVDEIANPAPSTSMGIHHNNKERTLQQLNDDFIHRKDNDNIIFARIRDELDAISNRKKEDRIIITGLTSDTPAPNVFEDRKKWLMEIVTKLLDKIDKNLAKEIQFINQGRSNGRDIPMVEVRFSTAEAAKKARMGFVEKKKAGEDFGKLHMANSVCLATRVRVDILKAIAKQFSSADGETMYVSVYSSRPVLHVREGDSRSYALTFADAVKRFGSRVEQEGLAEAYKRAGRAFTGQLEQHFVVLREVRGENPGFLAQRPTNGAKKRPLEDQNDAYVRSVGDAGNRGRGGARGRAHWETKMARK